MEKKTIRDLTKEEIRKTIERENKFCPILSSEMLSCSKKCAWYDDEINQCVIITLARK